MNPSTRSKWAAPALVWFLAAAILPALPVPPEPIPVARLVANLSDRISKTPEDVQAVFTLGRVEYFAFSGSTDTVNIISERFARPQSVPQLWDFISPPGRGRSALAKSQQPLTGDQRIAHLKNAITHLTRAVTMNKGGVVPDDGRYELCLACALEEGAPFAEQVGPIAGIPATRSAWINEARRFYAIAFDKAHPNDSKTSQRPPWGVATLISYEAGQSYQRLLALRPTRTTDEESRLAQIASFVAKMDKLPMGPITPLIFSVERNAPLRDLLSEKVVRFDLNGSKIPQRYEWVQPHTAILVWDPKGNGHITSGRQLFGSVTWWMLWDNAYQALGGLDDDHNGWLEGSELAGLALWTDRDENGQSNAGEVMPISATSIAGLAVQDTDRLGQTSLNAAGLRLKNGRLLPTYDWIATAK